MHTRQEETVMQLNNNDNITHLINPVKQNRWHTQVITLLMTVYMLITASFAMADVPSASATLCASEDQTCVLPAGVTATVWYGADTRWSIQSNITGSIDCSNNVFGDPAFGTVKNCYYEVTSSSSNVLPTVTLTSPSNNSSYTQGDSIPFAATAADSDGTIAKVEFFDGTTLIYTATTAPYSYNWTNTTTGTHSLTAKAYDDQNAVTVSAAVSVTVNAGTNTLPAAAILCASEDGLCTLPAGVTATVWYGADTRWSIQSSITGSIDCSNNVFGDPASGTVKNCYYEVTSSSSNVLPTVTLTSPSNNSSYTQGDSIPFAATAADSDGTIAKVEFFDGTTLIYTATTAPYSYNWTNATTGSHSLTAKAYDDQNAVTVSAAVSVTVSALAGTGQNLALGKVATQSSIENNGLPSLAVDGNADGDWWVSYSVTHTSYETQPWWQVDLAQTTALSQVTVWNRTDCCSDRTENFYVLASTTDMTDQTLTQLLADSSVTAVLVPTFGGSPSVTVQLNNAEARYVRVQLAGSNWLHLAEVQVFGSQGTPSNTPPTISLTSPSNNSSYTQGDSIPFAATAADSDGTIAKVEFFDGTTLIYTATTAPYSVGVTATTVGSHTVTAVATDNNGASTTSNAALVTITSAPVNSTPQAYYIHTDQLNTPRLITDNNNQAVWRWDNWEPFGNYITDEDPSNIGNHFTFNLRFPGQYFDSETQTHYNYFRDYDPSTGRYLQSDPIGLDGGINTYGYVNGSPLAYRDSTGLVIETIWDVGNVIYDIATGDWTALAVDTAAMCTPFVPAGITKLGKIEKGLEKTPTTHPKDFEPVRGCSAKRCKETKEIFDKDKLHKDHYEVYKDKKDFDKGKRNRDVYFDGRPKRKF
jgi:RHS repeat-associated protein